VGDGACVAGGVDTLDILCPPPRSDGYSQAVLLRKQEAHEGRVSEHCISKSTKWSDAKHRRVTGICAIRREYMLIAYLHFSGFASATSSP
jgi:hypothetical protein